MQKQPQKILDKWQFVFTHGRDWRYAQLGWRSIWFGVFKLTSLPTEGVAVQKKHYKGFLLKFKLWLPFEGDL